MKTAFYILALLCAILTSGCTKEEAKVANSMTAKIGGSSFSTSNVTFTHGTTEAFIEGAGSSSSILIYIEDYNGTGTYPVGTNWTVPTEYISSGGTQYAASGHVTITSTSPTVSGTFYFTCDNGTTISNGSFTYKN